MPFERNVDLPEQYRKGIPYHQQTLVRGLFNSLVYEENMSLEDASMKVNNMLTSAGLTYNNGWSVVNKKIEIETITKIDEDKRLVFGWASIIKDTEGKILLDRQNDYIDSEDELEKSAYSYVLNSRDGGEMHIRKGVSTMVESVVFTKEKQESLGIAPGTMPIGWWIGFRVNDERVWEEVKKGLYSGFSVHGTGQRNETLLKAGEYTEIEKHEESYEEPVMRVATRYVELLTKTHKYKMNKGEGPGHKFRGNQHTSQAGKGRYKKPGNFKTSELKPRTGVSTKPANSTLKRQGKVSPKQKHS